LGQNVSRIGECTGHGLTTRWQYEHISTPATQEEAVAILAEAVTKSIEHIGPVNEVEEAAFLEAGIAQSLSEGLTASPTSCNLSRPEVRTLFVHFYCSLNLYLQTPGASGSRPTRNPGFLNQVQADHEALLARVDNKKV
jgi:hypothetical protein